MTVVHDLVPPAAIDAARQMIRAQHGIASALLRIAEDTVSGTAADAVVALLPLLDALPDAYPRAVEITDEAWRAYGSDSPQHGASQAIDRLEALCAQAARHVVTALTASRGIAPGAAA